MTVQARKKYALDKLKETGTILVADTGDLNAIKYWGQRGLRDTTTNPSLLLKVVEKDSYTELVHDAVCYGRERERNPEAQVTFARDKLSVNAGVHILSLLPQGSRVSTEVDPRFSYDTEATVEHARRFIGMYSDAGIGRDRVLIKIAGTYQGIEAVRELEEEGIHTNTTLIFHPLQAKRAGKAGGTLVSPFVGRTRDAYAKALGLDKDAVPVREDRGVLLVIEIYSMLRDLGIETEVMGASFRTPSEVIALAGCDLLTISPSILENLAQMEVDVPRILYPGSHAQTDIPDGVTSETFSRMIESDTVAAKLLVDGIASFTRHTEDLEGILSERLAA